MVPRLREAHCLRDAWTKLNVHPAKIMQVSCCDSLYANNAELKFQQEQVLGELHWYINQEPPPVDAGIATETLEYLEACNLLFERGFLSHDRVRGINADVIQNINRGFSYFTGWLDSLLSESTYIMPKYVCVLYLSVLDLQILNLPMLQTHKNCSYHGKVSIFMHIICIHY